MLRLSKEAVRESPKQEGGVKEGKISATATHNTQHTTHTTPILMDPLSTTSAPLPAGSTQAHKRLRNDSMDNISPAPTEKKPRADATSFTPLDTRPSGDVGDDKCDGGFQATPHLGDTQAQVPAPGDTGNPQRSEEGDTQAQTLATGDAGNPEESEEEEGGYSAESPPYSVDSPYY